MKTETQQMGCNSAELPAVHTMYSAHVVLLVVLAALLCNWALVVEAKHEFNFTGCGGAAKCLGESGLERLRIRAGMKHRTRAQLAKVLDEDNDLVRSMTSN
jgi:hypothetical protein